LKTYFGKKIGLPAATGDEVTLWMSFQGFRK
jgi:hypothetical protein